MQDENPVISWFERSHLKANCFSFGYPLLNQKRLQRLKALQIETSIKTTFLTTKIKHEKSRNLKLTIKLFDSINPDVYAEQKTVVVVYDFSPFQWTNDQELIEALQECGVTDLINTKFFENRTNGQSKG